MTRRITWTLVLTLAAALTLLFSAAPAQAATGCGFAAPVVTVTLDPFASATLGRSGNAIQFNLADCGAATVLNTDTIVVTGAAGAETLTLQLGFGPFAPGASSEATGAPEIELEVDLGMQPAGARDRIVLLGTGSNDVYRLGSAGPEPEQRQRRRLDRAWRRRHHQRRRRALHGVRPGGKRHARG